MNKLKMFCMSRGGKIFLLAVIILVFLIPAGMIRGLIHERKSRANEAEREILKAWGKDFIIMGPVLRIPCQETHEYRTITDNKEKIEIQETNYYLYLTPDEFFEDVDLETTVKTRGIFSIPLFAGSVHLRGKFLPGLVQESLQKNQKAFADKAELIIFLANVNGIKGIINAEWNGSKMHLQPGTAGFTVKSMNSGTGVHSAAAFAMDSDNTFDIVFNIQGGKILRMVPIGKNSVFTVRADWPSPSFQGAYLPVSNEMNQDGFLARWEFSYLSQNIPLLWRGDTGNAQESFSYNDFEVNFFKAVDHYEMNMRAVKYAILFIIIPFLVFFLFELLLQKNIHPVQYLFAGIGNVVFYLLLLSLSEHIVFFAAYLISAMAVVLMTSLYSRTLLGSWSKSWIMGMLMAFLYAYLYFTLQSEDWALLIGSIGVFGITSVVMFITRKLDWWGRPELIGQ